MDTIDQALKHGEELLREMERKDREREERRRNSKTISVPIHTHKDGVTSCKTFTVPRDWTC